MKPTTNPRQWLAYKYIFLSVTFRLIIPSLSPPIPKPVGLALAYAFLGHDADMPSFETIDAIGSRLGPRPGFIPTE
jgi:hypothetical protein